MRGNELATGGRKRLDLDLLDLVTPTSITLQKWRAEQVVGRSCYMGAGVLPLVLGVLDIQDWYESE
jgi:hypothetical protein